MRVGKREQIVLVSIGALLSIFLIHLLIFKPRAENFAMVQREYDDGVSKLKDAEIPSSPKLISDYNDKTRDYADKLTSLAVQLNVDMPGHYMRNKPDALEQRFADTIASVKKLVELRATLRQPQLTFLDDRRQNPADPYSPQLGWNLPAKLPETGTQVQGAVWDTVVKLRDRWDLMNAISDSRQKLYQRTVYNDLLRRLYVNPAEVSDWVVAMPQVGYVFFNDASVAKQFATGLVLPQNPLNTSRYGVLIPALKKLWMAELIWAKRDQNSDITRERLRTILDVNMPADHSLFALNKQLKALIDIIQVAQQDGIVEISQVNLMKPVGIGKAGSRAAGAAATPTPTPTPAPKTGGGGGVMGEFDEFAMMGGPASPGTTTQNSPTALIGAPAGVDLMNMGPPAEQKVGGGAGIELWFRGSNSNVVKFLFDVTHMPRTYAVDDLSIAASPDGMVNTSTTIELVTNLKAELGGVNLPPK